MKVRCAGSPSCVTGGGADAESVRRDCERARRSISRGGARERVCCEIGRRSRCEERGAEGVPDAAPLWPALYNIAGALARRHCREHLHRAEQCGADEIREDGFQSNNAGGILGGISTGQDIVVRVGFKPTSSILTPVKTVDEDGNETDIITKGRHDPCVGIRAVPIAEAMMALTLMDHFLRHRGQNADVVCDIPKI